MEKMEKSALISTTVKHQKKVTNVFAYQLF